MSVFNMLNMHTICRVDNFRQLDDGKDQNGMRFSEQELKVVKIKVWTKIRIDLKCRDKKYIFVKNK